MRFCDSKLTSAGHMARDCRGRGDPSLSQNKQQGNFDSEYASLMAELGESATGIANPNADANRVPPWRIPENWNTNSESKVFHPAERN